MATRRMWVCLVTLTLIELASSDPMFTFVQDRLSKKEQDSVIKLFKRHWRPGVPDFVFEEHLTRIVYSPAILKEELPTRMVEILRALDNIERLEFVREINEFMEWKEQQKTGSKEEEEEEEKKEGTKQKKAKKHKTQ